MVNKKEKKEYDERKDKQKKAMFLQRFFFFFFDMLIVSFIVSLVTTPFVDTKKISKLEEKSIEVVQKFQNREVDTKIYLEEYANIYYKLARNSGIVSLITILFNVLYFIVYQIYAKGQTLGKKMLKIKVVSNDGELFMNQMIFRAFIANFILFDIINFGIMLFSPKSIYLYLTVFVEIIQWIIVIVSIIMVMNREDGCAVHDRLAHTMVVRES